MCDGAKATPSARLPSNAARRNHSLSTPDDVEQTQGRESAIPCLSSWPAASASILLSATSIYLHYLYSYVHWRVVFGPERYDSQLTEDLKSSLLTVLYRLEVYRVLGVFAMIWALWALRGRPRWPAWTALAFSLIALFLATMIQ